MTDSMNAPPGNVGENEATPKAQMHDENKADSQSRNQDQRWAEPHLDQAYHDQVNEKNNTNVSDLEKGPVHSSATSNTLDISGEGDNGGDPNIVFWDGSNDPANPYNWSKGVKLGHIALVSLITLITPLASSMFAPGVSKVMVEFKSTNEELASFVVSVFILGFAFGPLLIAPLSELYGRLPLYHGCNIIFIIFSIACAVSTDLNMLIVFRFFTGCAGAAPLTLGGGTIADLMVQEQRGGAMAMWALGPMMGPVIGPIAGGYLTQAVGWRWVFWVLVIAMGVVGVASIFFMRETYAPVLLERKAEHLRKETGNTALCSKLSLNVSPRTLLLRSIVRPTKLLLFSPIVLLLSIFMAVTYGYLYLLFTTFPMVFQQTYGFSVGSSGLSYLGVGIGNMIGICITGLGSDRIIKAKSAKGGMKPEYRLIPLVFGCPLIPIGLFFYGWTAQYRTHWILPIIGTGIFGVGMILAFMPISTYLVDAFTLHAASALAANMILRSILGATLPLAGREMYQTLHLGWGNSLLGFIALGLIPIPLLFYRYGEKIRRWKSIEL
ncbi:MFS general substrate transporter [Xylona heveae TC161]|uniref:MFS general substrate transporter n=1 Tax=Xylona heveae (strain CBS 132557 / TC161) TaxID=1328760 RepID=A0A165K473_XYLHT|nr:MFS general substrate transporter [Xylona heveae TC161]KZF26964.1 MFS general substrate transporter [Xylona heveae TC161]